MRGVEKRWVIRRQKRGGDVEYLRVEHNNETGGWNERWVTDLSRALPFSTWATVHRWLVEVDLNRAVAERWRSVFIGKDPQGIQRNLDRCLPTPDARERLESALSPETLQSRYLPRAFKMLGGGPINEPATFTIASEIHRLEGENRKPQAKSVPVDQVLGMVLLIQNEGRTWATLGDIFERNAVLNGFPYKVVAAKCGQLQKQGLLKGYSGADFRNELELTGKGRDRLQDLPTDLYLT